MNTKVQQMTYEEIMALRDVDARKCPVQMADDYLETPGQREIRSKYPIGAIYTESQLSKQELDKEEIKMSALQGLIPKKMAQRAIEKEIEQAEIAKKKQTFDERKKHFDHLFTPSSTEPVGNAKPKKSTDKLNYLKDILEIILLDALVLFSQLSVLRETLSVDQLIMRSLLVLAISLIALQIKVYYRQTERPVFRFFYLICTLLIASAVFTTIAFDMIYPADTVYTYNDFSLTEEVVEQTKVTMLDKYRAHPGIPELFVSFTILMICSTLVLKKNKSEEKPDEIIERPKDVHEANPMCEWQNELNALKQAVIDCQRKIDTNDRVHLAELKVLKERIEACPIRINALKQQLDDLKTSLEKEIDNLLKQLDKYEERWRFHMSLEMGMRPEEVTFVSITRENIYKLFNINV